MELVIERSATTVSTPESKPASGIPTSVAETSALSPETWPFDLCCLPNSACLVGGSVRDALLGRQADYLDLDFVLPQDAIAVARAIAHQHNAGFVVLDAKHQIARVVFPQATVDFAQQVGPTLETDLHRRDFTVNAIAYHPHSRRLLDPLNGYDDLQRQQLRMVSRDNLNDDPLRLLRAYRQAAQLGFTVESCTRQAIRELAQRLNTVAAERVRGELDSLLSRAEGTPFLQMAWQDGLLHGWLPQVTPAKLTCLETIDHVVDVLESSHPDYISYINGWLKEQVIPGFHRSWLKAAKLSQLLADPLDQSEMQLETLKYSRAEQQAVLAILKGIPYAHQLCHEPLSIRQQYGLFRVVGPSLWGWAVVALALGVHDETGTASSRESVLKLLTHRLAPLLRHYLDPGDPVAHPKPLLSGRDLIQQLQLRPGPQIGYLLEALQIAQAEGLVTNSAEALVWVQQHLRTAGEKPSSFP